jgi:Rad3-related DNA helicase
MIREYFSGERRSGFAYAYRYPGINRVLQAAGRVIRTARDRGTVLLIDRRYADRRYGDLLPGEWRPVPVRNPEDLASQLRAFWGDGGASPARTRTRTA